MRLAPILAVTLAVRVWWSAAPASAQSDYSVEDYIALQEEANTIYDAMLATDRSTPGWHDLAMQALNQRLDLVAYLGDWMRAGTMPDGMSQSAEETRAFLYQNIVAIYADMGQCDSASHTVDQLANVVSRIDLGPSGDELLLEANAAVTRCTIAAGELADAERQAVAAGRNVAQLRLNTARQLTENARLPSDLALSAEPRRVPRWSLVGGGAVAWVAALAIDITAATPEERRAIDACEGHTVPSTCTVDRAALASAGREGQEAALFPTLGLTALGAALITTGFLWPAKTDPPAGVAVGFAHGGITVSGRF